MAYVYRHIRLDLNIPFYIGIGTDKNYKRAFDRFRRSDFWKNITAKTDFCVEIIIDDISLNEAKAKESEFILLYGRKDINTGTLVNLTDGGDGVNGYKATPVTKQKISIALTGRKLSDEHRIKGAISRLGVKKSKEARAKMSYIMKGKKHSIEARKNNALAKRKFSQSQVSEIIKMRESGLSYQIIADKFSCSHGTIQNIIKKQLKFNYQ